MEFVKCYNFPSKYANEDVLKKIKILFVCVENSCRSQMAEGWARAYSEDIFEVYSSGSKPSGKVNETALLLMREKNIDLSLHRSKSLSEIPQVRWDYVVTMGCGDACPFVLAKTKIDWKIPDPKAFPIEKFREIRDLIETKVQELLVHAKEKI